MSLTVQPHMTVREQGRNFFADFPETPNATYFFSNLQMADGSIVWCRANRTAPGRPIYHLVKILNPHHPENREFQVVDTSLLELLERRRFLPFENLIFDREREIQVQEMQIQREEQSRSFAVIRQQQANIRQQQADIRQQHVTFERQIGALQSQNATFEQQNAQMRALNSRQDALIERLNSVNQIGRSELTRAQQDLWSTLGLSPTTDMAPTLQRIATGTANLPDPNPILGFPPSRPLPSANPAAPSPVINRVDHASASRNPPIALQASPLSSLPQNNDPSNISVSLVSQDNDELSFWQKMQEGISCLFTQIFSSIKQGWECFVSLF